MITGYVAPPSVDSESRTETTCEPPADQRMFADVPTSTVSPPLGWDCVAYGATDVTPPPPPPPPPEDATHCVDESGVKVTVAGPLTLTSLLPPMLWQAARPPVLLSVPGVGPGYRSVRLSPPATWTVMGADWIS